MNLKMVQIMKSDEYKIQTNKINKGLVFVGVTGGVAAVISLVSIPFITPAFRRICLPFVPATPPQIQNVLKALMDETGRVIDIGSGDGRIVRAVSKAGFLADGVELNYWLVLYSRWLHLLDKGCSSSKFFHRNLWKFNLKPYSNVVIFGTEQMMPELENKFLSELCTNSAVIACRYPLPNLTPVKVIGEGIDTVWKYRIQ